MSRIAPNGRPYPPALRAYVVARHEEKWDKAKIAEQAAILWPDDPISPRSVAKIIGFANAPMRSSTVKPFKPRASRIYTGQFKWLESGQLHECGHPTSGKAYCEACAKIILTGGDRKTYETTRPRSHPWIEDMKKYA